MRHNDKRINQEINILQRIIKSTTMVNVARETNVKVKKN
jgi:hypothetical protein